ncbi:uncharacterized protein with LGFP repeats [Microbacterium trichothecenolyticum]|uniref:excalibur calcium-binding domain-containing protein n=1 Tax=Microbacterium trichothecenolyticum TaxID=69370 RepID=UPI002855B6D1|nr:excalibur calcium-binding domain-containing protein [Microbacterium trichothecenolyticum]MDR7112500.1 uncharacterized protein with LGFP repeats [Microbacterium trichothecenolyticum]
MNLVSEYYADTTDYGAATLVTVGTDAPTTGIDAALDEGASISGTITLPYNVPSEWLKAVSVHASRVDGSSSSSNVSIDRETGAYTIIGLPADDYRVQFWAHSYWDAETQQSVPVNLISEYYDDTTDFGAAKPVTTAPDEPAVGIDATLELGSTISGTISLPAGVPSEWWNAVSVSVNRVGSSGGGSGGPVSIDSETGEYTISGLLAGDYRVQFSASSYWDSEAQRSVPVNLISEYYDNASDFAAAELVTTGPGTPATGIDALLEQGGSISGTLTDVDGAPVEGVLVNLIDVADPSRTVWETGFSDSTGAYSVSRIPSGVYKLLIGNFDDAAYRRVFMGGSTFASATELTVAPGSTFSGQNAVLVAPEPAAPSPAAPALSAGARSDNYAPVSWTTPVSADPIVGYATTSFGGWWGDGHPIGGPLATSTRTWVGEESTLVLVSAYTASAEGRAGAVIVNDADDPPAPLLESSGPSGASLTVSSSPMSAPADAEWWFGLLDGDGSATDLRVEYPDGLDDHSFTFDDVDSSGDLRLFAAWRSGGTMSQIAMLEIDSDTSTPQGPPVHPWFQARYAELGGVTGSLGAPLKGMECQSSSCWQEFAGGVLTSDGTQIVKLSTAYVTTWLSQGGPDGALGLVAGPEACFGTYCATPFTHGVITWTPNVGVVAIPVHAWFETKWKALGGLTGAIGAPVGAMQCQSSSCWQAFTGGVLTSDGQQIVKLSSAYVSTWLAWGGPNGDLGLVAGPEACFGSYCQTPFAGGVIVWVPGSGVFPVAKNWFYQPWVSRGGASGSLGLPADAMKCQSAACYQVFQNGTLTSSTSGIVALSSAYVSTWLGAGGPDGALGLISGPEVCFGTYCQVPFERGLMVWEPGVGVRILTGSELDAWLASHAPPTPSSPGDTKNCGDFSTHAEAQAWFDYYYPYYGDIGKLDANNDGIACESLP